jgi:hypothetical protein
MVGEKAKQRTYLSPQRAILLQIIEENFAERPMYFSNFASPAFYGGLEESFQNCGLVSKLLPVKTIDSDYAVDESKIEKLIRPENLSHYKTMKEKDMPRVSGVIMSGYSSAFLHLADIYKNADQKDKLKSLIRTYKDKMKIDIKTEYESNTIKELEK